MILPEEAVQLVRTLERAVNDHDLDALLRFYSDNAVMISPLWGAVAGRDAIGESWRTTFALYPDWRVDLFDVLVDRDRIAFMGTIAATDHHGWFGHPPTGKKITISAVIVLTMVDAQIARDQRIYDLTSVIEGLEKTRLDKELNTASEVQRLLLPRTQHVTAFSETAADSIPCRRLGGDFFELVDLSSNKLGIALGDVSGKGPSSALVAAMVQGMLSIEVQREGRPAAVLERLNQSLRDRHLDARFVTMIYAVLSSSGELVYSNAGHNAPVLLHGYGERRLPVGGPVLGLLKDATFEEETLQMRPNDTLVMFSDGVTEARSESDDEFGDPKLVDYLSARHSGSPCEIRDSLLQCVREFCGGVSPNDDITVAVTRFHRS